MCQTFTKHTDLGLAKSLTTQLESNLLQYFVLLYSCYFFYLFFYIRVVSSNFLVKSEFFSLVFLISLLHQNTSVLFFVLVILFVSGFRILWFS